MFYNRDATETHIYTDIFYLQSTWRNVKKLDETAKLIIWYSES